MLFVNIYTQFDVYCIDNQAINIVLEFCSGGGGPRAVMVKALGCGIVESEFEPQSRYYVHFRTNTLGKGMNPLILPAMD